MQWRNIEEAQWSSIYIQMHPTYQNHKHASDQLDTFLGPKSRNNIPIIAMAPHNGPVHVEYSIIINFMTSATEAEVGGLFEKY